MGIRGDRLRMYPTWCKDLLLHRGQSIFPLGREVGKYVYGEIILVYWKNRTKKNLANNFLNLTFMGPCFVIIFKYTSISNKMQRYTFLFYLETALNVSSGTTTHHQERKQLYLQHLVFVTPLLLPAAMRQVAVTTWQIPDAVDSVVCAPDDGWWYHSKHAEQFPDKIKCVTLHLVGYILE